MKKRKQKGKKWTQDRDKTRVYIGATIGRWRILKAAKGFRTDEDVALFLLDRQVTICCSAVTLVIMLFICVSKM